MTDRFFIDTNILVYAHDTSDGRKMGLARQLIREGLQNEALILSTQVLNEFFVTITRKLKKPISIAKAREEIQLLQIAEIILIDHDLILKAIDLELKEKISHWDALIVVCAQFAQCTVLFSEDLQHGRRYGNLQIINPFFTKDSKVLS